MGYGAQNRGDPFLGGLIKGAIGFVKGGIRSVLGGRQPQAPQLPPPLRGFPGGTPPVMNIGGGFPSLPAVPKPGFGGAVQRILPGGQSGYISQGIPRGYRPNKSGYFTRDGQFHPPGSKLVRVRTRNPANVRALRRALSRVESFGGIVKRARKTTRRLKSL